MTFKESSQNSSNNNLNVRILIYDFSAKYCLSKGIRQFAQYLAIEEDRLYGIDVWASFFKASTWEELKMLAHNNPDLQEAVATVYQMTQEEKIRQQCEAREDYYRRQNDVLRRQQKLESTNQQLTEQNQLLTEQIQLQTSQIQQQAEQIQLLMETVHDLQGKLEKYCKNESVGIESAVALE